MFNRRYLSVALTVTVLGVLAACGSDPTEESMPRGKRVSTTDHVSNEPRRSTAPSVLKRRNLPPDGVERQVSFAASGDSVCGRPKQRPTVVFDRRGFPPPAEGFDGGFPALSEYDEPEIGERFWICPEAFDVRRALRIAVTDPRGRTQTKVVTAPQGDAGPRGFIWMWEPRPGDPLGEYQVRAAQGSTVAHRTFRLHAASAPNIDWLTAGRVPAPGDDIQIMLFGFKPRESVRLNIYAGTGYRPAYPYQTSLLVRVGSDGTVIAALPTAVDDPPTCGVARVEIAAGPLDTFFCIQRE